MTKSQPIVIGSHTHIDFPKFRINDVPAKVDTGADSSSIWASMIKEKNGLLSFRLFAPGSKYYTGEEIVTKDYQIATVKNSFGHAEFRYKVRLTAKIEGQTVKIRFTLANRGNNNFPVLIGRRTLLGRFLVDVSKVPERQFNVLVLKPLPPKQEGLYASFFADLEDQSPSMKVTFATYDDLVFEFNRRAETVTVGSMGKDLSDFNLVHFLVIGNNRDIVASAARYLNSKNISFLDRESMNYYQTLNKLYQYSVLRTLGCNIPHSIFMSRAKLLGAYDFLTEKLGQPFVLKDINSNRGRLNFLIKNNKDFKFAIQSDEQAMFIAQKYLPNNGDYRLWVFGSQLKLVIKRLASKGTHLNNISAGGKAKIVASNEIPPSIQRLAIKVGEEFKLSILGIDMIKDKAAGVWYCLEVNENPQIVTGKFTEEKRMALQEYLLKKLRKI